MTRVGGGVSKRQVLATAAILAVAGAAGSVQAQTRPDPVTLRIVDRDTGQALRVWRHHGRLYVAGPPGARYSLRLTNNTDGRVLVVMSVDGVNILTGETANYNQRGYIFEAHASYDINGWRKSDTEVAAFSFAPLSQSYAARTGRPLDVGVVGAAVFKEKAEIVSDQPMSSEDVIRRYGVGAHAPPPPPGQPIMPPPPPAPAPPPPPAGGFGGDVGSSAPAPRTKGFAMSAARAVPQGEKLGTAHGERERSVVQTVNFERATAYPVFIRQIEYDSFANLVASGVIPRRAASDGGPRPFPSADGGAGYVPDPPRDP